MHPNGDDKEVTQPAVSIAVKRGQTLADTKGWRLPEE